MASIILKVFFREIGHLQQVLEETCFERSVAMEGQREGYNAPSPP